MDPEFPERQVTVAAPDQAEPAETRFLKWVLLGRQGVRTGWSIALFLVVYFLASIIFGAIGFLAIARPYHMNLESFTPGVALFTEIIQVVAVVSAMAACALVERRSLLDYNLRGKNQVVQFLVGGLCGAVALSALIAALHAGGWLQFGSVSHDAAGIAKYATVWGAVFLLTGAAEEGSTRCYLLFTLNRGINYRWALGTVLAFCAFTALNTQSHGPYGVYAAAALGVVPCLILHLKRASSATFWQAAWLTSTLFGYIHTFNHGEVSVGIFSAAEIGFLCCVSIRLLGSAWWAIGFHAAWDWMQTYFYGTPDSGLAPKGSLFTTSPSGTAYWSGGSAGPEGSVLVIPVVFLVLIALVALYGRKARTESTSPAAQPQLS